LLCLLIVVVASLGKFGGSSVAARFTGLNWRDASAIGVLMNTRGLMELIVLNIGLELHVISPTLFAMLILMALAGFGQLTNSNRSFGQGAAGYAKYYGASFADFAIGDYMTEAIYPSLLH
jgi:hypothetical protein